MGSASTKSDVLPRLTSGTSGRSPGGRWATLSKTSQMKGWALFQAFIFSTWILIPASVAYMGLTRSGPVAMYTSRNAKRSHHPSEFDVSLATPHVAQRKTRVASLRHCVSPNSSSYKYSGGGKSCARMGGLSCRPRFSTLSTWPSGK